MPHYDLEGRLAVLHRQPDLQGYIGAEDERYRVYTQDFVPWGLLPLWEDGGPQTVALTEWTVQYLTVGELRCTDPGYDTCDLQLYIHRQRRCLHSPWDYGHNRRYPCEVTEYHPLCWTTWSGKSAARGAAYDAGLIGLKVLERDAINYGFRTRSTTASGQRQRSDRRHDQHPPDRRGHLSCLPGAQVPIRPRPDPRAV